MSGRGILNADMQTLARWLSQGWHWWVDEIRGALPERLRSRPAERLPRLRLAEGGLRVEPGASRRAWQRPGPGARVLVTVPATACLTRVIERPRVGDRDLQQMLVLEAETLFPFPADAIVIAARRIGDAPGGRALVAVAALPIEHAREVAAAIAEARVVAVAVEIESSGDQALPPPDFAPAMRRAGLLARRRSATPMLWTLVGFLALLNLATWIWRDMANVDRLEALVSEQQPAVAVAQVITRRAEGDGKLVARSLALRRGHDALRTLADVGQALPDGAWLQRYAWDGATVRLAGYRPAGADIVTALRRSGRFTQIHTESADTQATLPTGDPFDVSARVVAR
jgi:hypothetical protein